MPRQPKEPPIACAYFAWRLWRRGGVYYADGRGRGHELGKHSLGTRDRSEALDRLRQLDQHIAVDRGLAQAPAAPTIITPIDTGWKLFLDHCGRSEVLGGVSAGTLKRYRAVRDHHVEFCRQHGIADWSGFETSAFNRYSQQLVKRAAYRTQYFELTLLKSVNGWLIATRHLAADCKLVHPLRKPQGTSTYCYSRDEVAAMIRHCRTNRKLTWLGNLIIVLAHTGLRISEAANLRWSDINLTANTIHVADERTGRRRRSASIARTTKGRRSRTVPIHPRLRELLLTLERAQDGYVLHAPQGGVLRPRNVLTAFIAKVIVPLSETRPGAAGDISFEDGRLHSFRHFFCSQAFLGGASEGEIKEWLGHKEAAMVEHYRHLRDEDAQRKMARINFLDDGQSAAGGVA